MSHDFLKPVLGEELFEQVNQKLAGAGLNLVNTADGSYVPKAKFDTELAARKQYMQQSSDLHNQMSEAQLRIEALTRDLTAARAEGESAKALKEKNDQLSADLTAAAEKVRQMEALRSDLDRANAKIERREKEIARIQKHGRILDEIRLSGAKNPAVLIRMIDTDKVTEEDGKMKGLEEQIGSLRKSDPYLFGGQPSDRGGVGGGEPVHPADLDERSTNQKINEEIRRAAGF